MKIPTRLTSLILGLLFVISFPIFGLAQTSSPALPPTASEPNQAINQPPSTPNAETVLDSQRQARVTNLAANISTRMDNAVKRLENIAERLEIRRQLLAETGLDTTITKTELAVANEALARARTELSTIDADVIRAFSANDPITSWGTVRSTYLSIRSDIFNAYEALSRATTGLQNPTTVTPPATSTTPQ